MIYSKQKFTMVDLHNFVSRYKPKVLEFNVEQLEYYFSMIWYTLPENTTPILKKTLEDNFKTEFSKYLNGKEKLKYNGISINLI